MAIPAVALLQQYNARWDIVIEPAAQHRAAIEARRHSELRAFGAGGRSDLGAQSGRKNQLACLSVGPIANLKGNYFQPSLSMSLSVCVCVSDRHFYPSMLTDFDETWSQGPYSDLVWPRP